MKRLLLAILIVLASVSLQRHAAAQTTSAKGFVENMLESILGVEGRSLSVENASISLTGDLTIGRVEVRDDTGTWLEIEELALVWRPLSLFGKQLEVDGFTARSVHVLRKPLSAEGSVAAPEEFEGLTAALVKRLAIETLTIDEPVLGQAAELTMEGAAEIVAEPPEIRFDMTASRRDGKLGNLKTSIVLDPQARSFKADLTFQEEADGILAAALSLRGEPSVDLGVSAAGKFGSWKGNFTLDLDKQRVIEGEAGAATDASGQTISVDGTGAMARLLPQSLEQAFTGTSTLSAAVLLPPEGGAAQVDYISLDNAAFSFSIAGVADWAGTRTKLAAELKSKDPSVAFALPETGFLGKASVSGLAAAMQIDGALTAPSWKVDLAWVSAVSDRATLDDLALSLEGQGIVPTLQPVTFGGDLKLVLGQGGGGKLPPVLLGPASAEFKGLWRDGDIVELNDARLTLAGVKLETSGQLRPEAGSFDLLVAANAQSPETGYGFADRLLRGPVKIQGRVNGGQQQGLALSDVTLISAALSARASGTVAADAVDATLDVSMPDLALVHEDITGNARFDLAVQGSWQALEARLQGGGDKVMLLGKALENPQLAARLALQGSAASGDVSFKGNLAGKPVNAAARLETTADGAIFLRDVEAASGSARLSGELSMPSGGRPVGRLAFDAPDLRDVGPLFLSDIAGTLTGEAELTETDGAHAMRVDFAGRDIVAASAAFGSAKGGLVIQSPFDAPRPAGKATLTAVRFGTQSFQEIDITAEASSGQSYAVTGRLQGRDLSANAQAQVTFADDEVTYALSQLSGKARNVAFKAVGPITLRQQGETLSVDEAVLSVGSGRVKAAGQLLPKLDARLNLSALPLQAFEKLAGAPGLQGSLAGDVTLSGAPGAPNGEFKLNVTGLTLAALREQGIRPFAVSANGRLDAGTLKLSAKASSAKDMTLTGEGTIALGETRSIDMTVKGRAGSKVFSDRLARSGLRAEGAVDLDLRIRGALAKPAFSGSLTLSKGIIGDTAGRFTVRDARGRIDIQDRVLRIASLAGTTGRKGRASASGTVSLEGGMAADLRAKIENGVYTDGSFLTSRYDADLAVAGPLIGTPVVTGTIALSDTKITLSEMPRRALAPLDVKHKKAPTPVARQAAELRRSRPSGDADLSVDVKLTVRDRISVSGRGLNVVLNGGLRVFGPIGDLAAEGSFRLFRGSLALPARSLDFERGSLTFDRNFDPLVNFVAVSRRSDATITLTVQGRASEPEILVTSVPQLPQEEAMARLIFDSSMLELSPVQIAQIASYVATLSGGGGSGLLTGLQSALGFDYLNITETESGEAQIGVAKRLNDKLSIGVEQTTKSNTTRVIIDLNATKNLKLRGAVGSDQSSRAGIYYEKDY